MFPSEIHDLARKVIETYTDQKRRIVTAESCTGGLVAAALTQISGASAVIERGFISYSNDAKTELLGVMPDILERYGAVSEQAAEVMAQGALDFSRADIAISVTGIAGPTGGTCKRSSAKVRNASIPKRLPGEKASDMEEASMNVRAVKE